MSNSGHLCIRADASVQIGTGHMMRCLALAQCWQDHIGPVTFVCHQIPDGLRHRLESEGFAVRLTTADVGDTIAIAHELDSTIIVLDGYHFTAQDEELLQAAGISVVAVDDFGHTAHPAAAIILNQNFGATADWYQQSHPNSRLLLGSRFAMLRREFASARTWSRVPAEMAQNILITMGGADPPNVTTRILDLFASIKLDVSIRVVIGGTNPHGALIEQAANRLSHHIELLQNVADMPALMKWADLAITAGGTTCWELAAFGVPMVVITLAQNQVELAKAIHAGGMAQNLGWPDDLPATEQIGIIETVLASPERRAAMAHAGKTAVDGWGVTRVVQAMQPKPVITLRPATETDSRVIWEWANDPATRAVSFQQAAIPWESHQTWYSKRLANPDSLILIAHDTDGQLVGMTRFDRSPTNVVISINMAPTARGQGYGATVIERGTHVAMKHFQVTTITAYILPSNIASQKVFSKAGYHLTRQDQHLQADVYTKTINECV